MTQEEKNRQDPEVAEYCERKEIKRKYVNISYANRTDYEKLDIYLPETGDGPFPVLIDVHGGGWFYGSRSSKRMDPVLLGLDKGYVVVSVDYTLSKYEKFPLQVCELKAAIRFLRKNADKYKLDVNKMAMWGLSAGAHLAMLTAYSADSKMLDDAELSDTTISCRLQALVALYGPVNLGNSDECTEESMESILLGTLPQNSPETVKKANPCTYVTKEAPPTFLQYGDSDEIVSIENGMEIYKTLENSRTKQDYYEVIHGAKHADKLFRTNENNKKIYEFLELNLMNTNDKN